MCALGARERIEVTGRCVLKGAAGLHFCALASEQRTQQKCTPLPLGGGTQLLLSGSSQDQLVVTWLH